MNKLSILVAILALSSLGISKPKSKKTIFIDGLDTASYSTIVVDRGQVNDRDFSTLKVNFGFQFIRYDDLAYLTIGFGKSGFYDAVKDWSSKRPFQFNYQGATVGLGLFPSYLLDVEVMHWFYAAGKSTETITGRENPVAAVEDYIKKYDYDVKDTSIYIGYRFRPQVRFIIGAGFRSLSWDAKTYRQDQEISVPGDEVTTGSDSDMYLLIGVKGSSLME
ncbi:hypothetical protein [Pseudobacteriovorax antillogorgiicola]|uniref:Uncharacterized protein n=1 Tax=Pseudobacteriovorax antillogorgiicola TaxID=1513793 RepID=A0A1Y6C768_9BACT|nr:hypothetical protein [Pseudobacteriovorax antillogorgiicola]TCS49352.1 hypothetical protein EDD56_11532 [Pseudobacteriovorax antillogorgiicola]SMF47613.1 hypothetical protein SAMN06296036_114152 [Pseudobacteriovorax antillogorgiicola]